MRHSLHQRSIAIRLAAVVCLFGLAGCAVQVRLGSWVKVIQIGATPTIQSTYTSYPTLTPRPTYTPLPTLTPNPSLTLRPTYTFLPAVSATPGPAQDETPTPSPTADTTAGEGEIAQYASSASAGSEYSYPQYGAIQAVGAPNVTECGDNPMGWASRNANSVDWLLLTYDEPVIPTRIIIYQSYNPGAVSLVEVIDEAGNASVVYTAVPAAMEDCPAVIAIDISDVTVKVKKIRVTVDQSPSFGWSEIDAVQLIGRPD